LRHGGKVSTFKCVNLQLLNELTFLFSELLAKREIFLYFLQSLPRYGGDDILIS